jgi:hypothetical protein
MVLQIRAVMTWHSGQMACREDTETGGNLLHGGRAPSS